MKLNYIIGSKGEKASFETIVNVKLVVLLDEI
jgi:hypothetical protein